VFVGTLYPLALEALTGDKISVGAPFFNLTFLPLIAPLLVLVPFGQTLAWKRGDVRAAAQRLMAVFGVALAASLALLAASRGGPVLAPLGIGLGVFLVLGSVNEIAGRAWRRGQSLGTTLARAAGLPRSAWGSAVAHGGVGLTVIGIAAAAWGVEALGTLKPGAELAAGPYAVRLNGVVPRTGPNYREDVALLTLTRDRVEIGAFETAKRVYLTRPMPTTEAGIVTVGGFGQVYASFGDPQPDGSIGLRLYYKPLVLLIWLGAVVMALGGALSLTDRRMRVGAPARARTAAVAVPAE
jgi:cytochrome c-type biogenesis protein CcmF